MTDTVVDHIIVHTDRIDEAAAYFADKGFTVQTRDDAGPSHGMENRFVVFADGAYLLLIQFGDASKKAAHRLAPYLGDGHDFADYGMAVPDSMAAEKRASESGLVPSAPKEFRNTLKDGRLWGVRLFTVGRSAPSGDDALPFIVQELEARAARVPSYVPHGNGLEQISDLHIEAENAARASGLLKATVDAPDASGGSNTVALSGATAHFHQRDPKRARTRGKGGLFAIDITGRAGAYRRRLTVENGVISIMPAE